MQGDLFRKPYFVSIVYSDRRQNKIINCVTEKEAHSIARRSRKTEENLAYMDVLERKNNGPQHIWRYHP